jgi:hypothetical protein
MSIGYYFINGYWLLILLIVIGCLFHLMAIGCLLMAIHGYYINGYLWLFVAIILMAIHGYYISGYWWLIY